MPLEPELIAAWADAYIRESAKDRDRTKTSDDWWAVADLMLPKTLDNAENAWQVIHAVLARKPSDRVISVLAAGPLEDLIAAFGPEFIDRIEQAAKQDPAFRHLLGGVWKRSTDAVWARIERARGAVW
ncbi:hypothetical protein C7S18_22245 [Ahniella affigens]|uniref:DUF6869 domain-containing protein n=1 Tax=Ahniella affigens TaxID=2021234 RepID=A0A2P1PXZ8_9GAMM|nr:hypothetical protein [Ahniella affigens]AVP99727.1 hypothetical protein C7S18_22245 [Ahniella affigens]